jgi:hypothetical protein
VLYRKKAIYLVAILLISTGVLLSSCGDTTQQTNTPPVAPKATMYISPALTPLPAAPQGYNVVAQFHGTGDLTFNNLNIHLVTHHDVSFTCLGTGQAIVHFTPPHGQLVSPIGLNGIPCPISENPPLDVHINNKEGQIQQVIVIADATTTWQLQLMNCTANNATC